MASTDTIYALSSGGLPSGVAVIRLSGPESAAVVRRLAGDLPAPRQMTLAVLRDEDGGILDRGLVAFFAGPTSFTGEDCCEFHVHGGRASVAALLRTLSAIPGMRPAEAGEFTRRAFANGKLDLTRAEGLADLISAETEQERRLAIATSGGTQERLYSQWRKRLLHARAMIEAELDFSDESDVAGSVAEQIWPDLHAMIAEISEHTSGYRTAEMIRDGYRVAIMGAPNVGKSSLLNAIAGREAAIVTPIPGTTRDIVQVMIDLNGKRVIFSDTAGLRFTDDVVESIGIDRAYGEAEKSNLILHLSDDPSWPANVTLPEDVETIRVLSKADLLSEGPPVDDCLVLSTVLGTGLSELLSKIETRASRVMQTGDGAIPTRLRHVAQLRLCLENLQAALVHDKSELEIVAEELRRAAEALGRLTGAVDVEEILGAIFSTFCIGK